MGFIPGVDDSQEEDGTEVEADKSGTPKEDSVATEQPTEKADDQQVHEDIPDHPIDEEIEELDISNGAGISDIGQALVTTGATSYDPANLPLVDLENPLFGTISNVDPKLYAYLSNLYQTDEEQKFVQSMSLVSAKIGVIGHELSEEYFDVDSADEERGP
ncbi:hypothetical protein BGZ83_004331, partial [Gryganskiella cystojenkinii]